MAAYAARPYGTILVPLISYCFTGFVMGWAQIPYDPIWAERYPKRAFWMSMAGPAANLFQVILAFGAVRILLETDVLDLSALAGGVTTKDLLLGAHATPGIKFFGLILMIGHLNLLLFIYNLMPFPPLDGSSIWRLVLSADYYARYREIAGDMNFWVLGLIVASALTDKILAPILRAVYWLALYGF